MALTKEQCQQMVDACFQAELDVLAGKETTFEGRSVKMEDLDKIRAARQEWESKLDGLLNPRRLRYGLARFV
ncbi:MAG: hypothetical protein ACK5NC_11595 [Vibrio sp.]